MRVSTWLSGFCAAFVFSSCAVAVEMKVKRSAIETEFLEAAQGKAHFFACVMRPKGSAFEVCMFRAGQGIAVYFYFDAKTQEFRATTIFFHEKEADLAIAIGKMALKVSGYAEADAIDFSHLLKEAVFSGKKIQVSEGVNATLVKAPPGVYSLTFSPQGH